MRRFQHSTCLTIFEMFSGLPSPEWWQPHSSWSDSRSTRSTSRTSIGCTPSSTKSSATSRNQTKLFLFEENRDFYLFLMYILLEPVILPVYWMLLFLQWMLLHDVHLWDIICIFYKSFYPVFIIKFIYFKAVHFLCAIFRPVVQKAA